MLEQRTLLSTGERFEVSRASNAAERGSVVLKTVRSDRRAPRSEELLRHEWNVLRGLDIAGVARPLRLEHGESGPILVLEDAGPRNLRDLLDGRPLDTPRFLELAISMAETLGEVHRHGLIHRDICPMNFVVGDHPTLVDFESATATPAFTQAPDPPGELQGTLAYIAPEQTGRMNRGVDRRADLYALGATFYEMLTGAPPFSDTRSAGAPACACRAPPAYARSRERGRPDRPVQHRRQAPLEDARVALSERRGAQGRPGRGAHALALVRQDRRLRARST